MNNSIKHILTNAKSSLKGAGVETYSLDAEILLSLAIDKPREFIIGHREYELQEGERRVFDGYIQRRMKREPVAYITGKKEFWGQDFIVTPDTLIPRPDSETLIEACLEMFPDMDRDIDIIDLGTGTGCLLLSLLSEYCKAKGVGIDISAGAIEVAKDNSLKLNLADRVDFVVKDWNGDVSGRFDLVISNPPYIRNSSKELLETDVSMYEPCGALFAGRDGMECYASIAEKVPFMLSDDAYLILECGMGQEQEIKEIFEQSGLDFVGCRKDLAGIVRCLIFNQKKKEKWKK